MRPADRRRRRAEDSRTPPLASAIEPELTRLAATGTVAAVPGLITVLVTAGPTREHLDDVRFLSNGSSGRMGYALAEAARDAGCRVILVSGPTALPPPDGVEVVPVVSARDMLAACERVFDRVQVVFAAAAVADHRPRERRPGKPEKGSGVQVIELVENPDVVATLAARKQGRVMVGFALDAAGVNRVAQLERARRKLSAKNLDLLVANDARAMAADEAVGVALLWSDGRTEDLPDGRKEPLAAAVVAAALRLLAGGA